MYGQEISVSNFVELCLGVIVLDKSACFTHIHTHTHTHTTLSQTLTINIFFHTTCSSHMIF